MKLHDLIIEIKIKKKTEMVKSLIKGLKISKLNLVPFY